MPLRHTRGFKSAQHLSDHFKAHGLRLGLGTEKEYGEFADAFLRGSCPQGAQKFRRLWKDDLVPYDESSNVFAVLDAKGFIKTCYLPDPLRTLDDDELGLFPCGEGEGMGYQCPVCGFLEMPYPPEDYNICPCCGTEFGYHDFSRTHSSLRRIWIDAGCRWFSSAMQLPAGWNPFLQLLKAGLAEIRLHVSADAQAMGVGPATLIRTASENVGTIAA